MNNLNKKGFVLQRILYILTSMEPLIIKNEFKGKGIYKNDVLFCLVDEKRVYFNPGKYHDSYFMDKTIKLPFRELKDIHAILYDKIEKQEIDRILKYATESYWLMSGLKK